MPPKENTSQDTATQQIAQFAKYLLESGCSPQDLAYGFGAPEGRNVIREALVQSRQAKRRQEIERDAEEGKPLTAEELKSVEYTLWRYIYRAIDDREQTDAIFRLQLPCNPEYYRKLSKRQHSALRLYLIHGHEFEVVAWVLDLGEIIVSPEERLATEEVHSGSYLAGEAYFSRAINIAYCDILPAFEAEQRAIFKQQEEFAREHGCMVRIGDIESHLGELACRTLKCLEIDRLAWLETVDEDAVRKAMSSVGANKRSMAKLHAIMAENNVSFKDGSSTLK